MRVRILQDSLIFIRLFIKMRPKRKSGHSAAGKAAMQSRWGGDAAADDDAPEDSVAVTASDDPAPVVQRSLPTPSRPIPSQPIPSHPVPSCPVR